MCFKTAVALSLAAAVAVSLPANGPRFLPDDPVWTDDDRAVDAGKVAASKHSEAYDFLDNTFRTAGRVEDRRALNVNTLDEVPDSSWFTNRLGRREVTLEEIRRGPDTIDDLEVGEWVVVAGKGPMGQQPGFRAVDASDKRQRPQVFQLEGDLQQFPELSTGAEMVGTFAYHALGYNVVDTYLVHVDPARVRIAPDATIRDDSGRRPFRQADLHAIFRSLARNPDGTYRMTASRFVEGTPLEGFRYHGTRPDDPNDIHPHQHRRELRGNRVFAAWLNHDDSRGINTLDVLREEDGRRWVKHYMFDFGSILGSTPRRGSGHEYMFDPKVSRRTLASLGFWVPEWYRIRYPGDLPVAIQRFESEGFAPVAWKPQYPNAAFENMRADDAFWAARILSAFSNDAIAEVVRRAEYSHPGGSEHLVRVLIERRDRILETWLTGLNPVVDFVLDGRGLARFANAAERAGIVEAESTYLVSWSRFDNEKQTHTPAGAATRIDRGEIAMPVELADARFIALTVRAQHPRFPIWAEPTVAYFRNEGRTWTTVGIERTTHPRRDGTGGSR